MSNFSAFPKIFHLGDRYTTKIFDAPVEITEKIDGSQFCFGKIDEKVIMRSKGREIFFDNVDKMFLKACEHVLSIANKIPNNRLFYCEYLNKPKHNVLTYGRVPTNHLMLFAISDEKYNFKLTHERKFYAEKLGIEAIPVLYTGIYPNGLTSIQIDMLLGTDSILGNTKIEGFVVKNYQQEVMCGGMVVPLTCAKFVSEKFKEKHDKDWKTEHTSKGKWEVYCSQFCNEARWIKAIQHLAEKGQITHEAKDIGKLIMEVKHDIVEEHKQEIKDVLWRQFSDDLLRVAVKGIPEFYKKRLVDNINEEKA